MVVTRHLDMVGITDLSADGIYTALISTLTKYCLLLDKLLSFTSDTCSVMKGAKSGVISKFRTVQPYTMCLSPGQFVCKSSNKMTFEGG